MPLVCGAVAMIFAALGACSSGTGPGGGGGGTFGNLGSLLGGYSGTGFSSFDDEHLDPQFDYMYFGQFTSEGPKNCLTDGFCGLGGLRNSFGVITEPDSFLFVTTANFTNGGTDHVVINSGVVTKPITIANAAQYSAVRVSFELVFASARTNTTHNDSIIVRAKAGTDSSTVFKATFADLQSGRFTPRGGGCGTASIISTRSIAYPACTAWTSTTADITAYKGRPFVLQFIAAEGGQTISDHTDQPVVFLFRKVAIEGMK